MDSLNQPGGGAGEVDGEELDLGEAEAGDGGPAVIGCEAAEAVDAEGFEREELGGGGDEAAAGFVDRDLDAAGQGVEEGIVGGHGRYLQGVRGRGQS